MKFKAFAIIPRKEEIEIKPLVLCRECKWWNGIVCENGIIRVPKQGDCFCSDGEKKREGNTRRYYTQDGTITWEGEEDG